MHCSTAFLEVYRGCDSSLPREAGSVPKTVTERVVLFQSRHLGVVGLGGWKSVKNLRPPALPQELDE
jgi:hypothetical protein